MASSIREVAHCFPPAQKAATLAKDLGWACVMRSKGVT